MVTMAVAQAAPLAWHTLYGKVTVSLKPGAGEKLKPPVAGSSAPKVPADGSDSGPVAVKVEPAGYWSLPATFQWLVEPGSAT